MVERRVPARAHTMSPAPRLLFVVTLLLARLGPLRAGSVCSEDFYGVMQGTPHKLPEHYLLPRVFDWAIAVPSVCGGEVTSGVEARVCVWVTAPSIRLVDRSAALVHTAAAAPSYLTVNVTVYCGAPGPHPTTTLASSLDSSAESAQALLRATPLFRSAVRPYWSLV